MNIIDKINQYLTEAERAEITAYKLFRVRSDGSLGSLFIKAKDKIPVGEWLDAEDNPTAGFAQRKGWHAVPQPIAPHLSPKGRAWYVVKLRDAKLHARPKTQGGNWYLANQMKVIRAYQPEQ
jgi:hypothetical protein